MKTKSHGNLYLNYFLLPFYNPIKKYSARLLFANVYLFSPGNGLHKLFFDKNILERSYLQIRVVTLEKSALRAPL